MTRELFPDYVAVISLSIIKADTAKKRQVCAIMIDHLENDYLYMPVQQKDESIQGLRDQLQERHDETEREKEPVIINCKASA